MTKNPIRLISRLTDDMESALSYLIEIDNDWDPQILGYEGLEILEEMQEAIEDLKEHLSTRQDEIKELVENRPNTSDKSVIDATSIEDTDLEVSTDENTEIKDFSKEDIKPENTNWSYEELRKAWAEADSEEQR